MTSLPLRVDNYLTYNFLNNNYLLIVTICQQANQNAGSVKEEL